MYAGSETDRVLFWALTYNGAIFTEGDLHRDSDTGLQLPGKANAVYYDTDGSGGLWAVYQQVSIGDTIGLISDGTPYALWVGATFTIEQIEEPQFIPTDMPGDLTGDRCVDISDLVVFAVNWVSNDCDLPNNCGGADSDLSGRVDYTDYTVIGNNWLQCIAEYKNLGYVLVSPNGPDDGGDFGPNTPGTTTSGIQEALIYAQANSRDVYIVGGGTAGDLSTQISYDLDSTLYVPVGRNWRIDGGDYRLVYTSTSGSALFIDSQTNSFLKFGLVIGGQSSDQPIVNVQPITAPVSGSIGCSGNTFEFAGILGNGGVDGTDGIGLLLDGSASSAGVCNNSFYIGMIQWCDTAIYLKDNCNLNMFESPFIHLSQTGIQIGSASSPLIHGNQFSGHVTNCPTGVQVFGKQNLFMVNITNAMANQGIIFETSAVENFFVNGILPEGFTNNATNPTNRIIKTGVLGYGFSTPSVPASGIDVVNTFPYPVEVQIVTAGQVSAWTVTDANGTFQTFNNGLFVGQRFGLNPGYKVRFTYTQAPTWRWMAKN